MRELSPWTRASRRSWSRRWTAGSPWTTGGGWWSSTRPPSGSLAPPQPGDGLAADRAHHLPAAAPGASRRAGPLPGNRRGTVLGQHLELTAVRADGSELPVELSITKVALPGPPVFTACLWDLTGRKQARAEQQAPGKRLRRAGRGATRGCSPGFPQCRPLAGSVTRPARRPGHRRRGRHDHRGDRPGTSRPGARHGRTRLARPAATGLIAPGNHGPVDYLATRKLETPGGGGRHRWRPPFPV